MTQKIRREGIKKCVFALSWNSRSGANETYLFLIFAHAEKSYMNSLRYFEMSTEETSCFTSGKSRMNGISSV